MYVLLLRVTLEAELLEQALPRTEYRSRRTGGATSDVAQLAGDCSRATGQVADATRETASEPTQETSAILSLRSRGLGARGPSRLSCCGHYGFVIQSGNEVQRGGWWRGDRGRSRCCHRGLHCGCCRGSVVGAVNWLGRGLSMHRSGRCRFRRFGLRPKQRGEAPGEGLKNYNLGFVQIGTESLIA